MTKRTVSVILILLLLLPAVMTAGGVLFAPVSPFEGFDKNREDSLSAALGESASDTEISSPLPENGRYIIKFKSDTPLKDIEAALNGSEYRLLAESELRLFAVVPENRTFLSNYADIIDYYEPDLTRESLAVTNDTVTVPAFESVGVYQSWDTVRASSDIIVAVLDTGVDRTHEDLLGVNILPGYDAVSKTAGVDGDTVGHGTGVIGIIAATADNGLGFAGVAHGVTVLPVKVSSSSTTIYSSDLISGIRFAADAGAKVINLSVGGYSSSYAEQEAVNYAVSKGCILISASGNGGNRPYADQKSYPASYDGVISVASSTPDGKRSEFSQYNDAVDVAAPGEMIAMPFVENGVSVYRTDSGTSYSCAIVSGIAALAVSRAGKDVRFGSEEFTSLIIETCGSERTGELGYGIINSYQITNLAHLPIITGVVNGGTYSDRVKIGFNRGTATLDGEPFDDGETVISNGRHIITVTDGEAVRTASFRLDYDPLSYEFKEFAAFSYFEFDRGSATLDGFPYTSGDRIITSGRHEFVIVDGEERLEQEIYLQYTLPTVYGIENGGVYTEPVEIRVIGDGSAELDGIEIYGEVAVAENGKHTLTVRSGNGAVTMDYEFEINFPYMQILQTDYAMGLAAVDEENSYICLYGESLVGARIYDIDSPERFLHFLQIGRVYSHAFTEDKLLLFGDGGVTVVSRENALDPENAVETVLSPEGMDYFIYADGIVYCFDSEGMYTLDTESGETELVSKLDFECETAFYSDGIFCLLAPSSDRLARIYNVAENTYTTFDIGMSVDGVPLYFNDIYLAAGNRLIDITNGETVLEFCSTTAVKIDNGLLFTDNRITEIATGREIGSFPFLVSDVVFGSNAVYLFGVEEISARIENGAEGVSAYGAAERLDKAVAAREEINVYRDAAFYDRYLTLTSAKANGENVFMLFNGRNALYGFSATDFTELDPVPLKYIPKALFVSGGYVTVTFADVPIIYLAPEENINDGVYITLPAECDSTAVAEGRLYAVSGGRLIHCLTDGSATVVTSVQAKAVDTDGVSIYVLDELSLTAYDLNLVSIRSIPANGVDGFFVGGGVAIGGVVYDRTLQNEIARINETVLAFRGDTIVTGLGVYDLFAEQYIGTLGVNSAEAVAVSGSNAVISFGNSLISVCSFDDGASVTAKPEISGITDGSIYTDSVTIKYAHGIGYLDGVLFESGSAASGAGVHTFLVALPCGQSITVTFTIEANIEAIEFLVGDRTMSVGEKVTLRVKYLPEGASSVPVTFLCESDGLTIGEMGEITANTVGEYTVTALVSTNYGNFSARCVITVRDDLIVFTEESGLRVDRDNGFILGVLPDTTADELAGKLLVGGSAEIFNPDGRKVSGVVATGDKMLLRNGNEITDELTVVIVGDTDGDGYISAYDLYVLERILRGHRYDPPYIASADINGNGVLADNDYRALRNIILGVTEQPVGTPDENLFGLSSVQTLSYIESGTAIDVAVCLSGCKYARGISGILNVGEGLEFEGGESSDWEVNFKNLGGGKISFYAHGNSGEECGKAFKVLLYLRFRVTASAGKTVTVSSEGLTASFEDGCKTIRFENTEKFVYGPPTGEFGIEFHNAHSFEFKPDVYEYTAIIPYNSALADISVTRAIGQTVSVTGTVIPDSGNGTVSVNVINPDGSSELYSIRVRRENEPHFDTNCRLATLEIEGHRLNPQFDPDILDYTVYVPYGTERINIYCVAQSATAQVIIGDTRLYGDETSITVTVGSPNGESLTYTINAVVLPPEDESDDESLPDDGDSDGIPWYTLISLIGVLVIAPAIIVVYIKLAKRDDEMRAKEQADKEQE